MHNAVDLVRFDPAARDRDAARGALGLPDGAFAAGVVGQITPWKGQLEAVDAVGALAGRYPELHLLVVGEAKFVDAATRYDNRAYVARLRQAIAARGLDGRIRLLGEREDVPAVLRASRRAARPLLGGAIRARRARGHGDGRAGARDARRRAGGDRHRWPRRPAARRQGSGRLGRGARPGDRDAGLRDALGAAGRRRAADFSPARHAAAVLAAYDDASTRRRAARRACRPARRAVG